jgi:hypothetical protein
MSGAIAAWLGFPPSFLVSPVIPALYTGMHAFVYMLPSYVTPSIATEGPWSIIDGFTRAYLVCQLIPPAVVSSSNPIVVTSPWTLILASLITANGGFFLVNLMNMLHPAGWSLSTPLELQAYGWSTIDLWCAPLGTALYAFWTHAQPWWGELHAASLGYGVVDDKVLQSIVVDSQTAMSRVTVLFATLFTYRTIKNHGLVIMNPAPELDKGKDNLFHLMGSSLIILTALQEKKIQ